MMADEFVEIMDEDYEEMIAKERNKALDEVLSLLDEMEVYPLVDGGYRHGTACYSDGIRKSEFRRRVSSLKNK